MTTTATTVQPMAPAAAEGAVQSVAPPKGLFGSCVELTKPRITRLVTITAAVGFGMGALTHQGWTAWGLTIAGIGALVGTALSAAGASALNQWWERQRDAIMPRTIRRPLPQGRVSPALALLLGLSLSVAGVVLLWLLAGLTPALVSLFTILSYVLLYTPLKTMTPLATLIGAVPGALPPLIGWTAATAAAGVATPLLAEPAMNAGGWALFVLMLVWQVPHFLAIAWMYREDYAKGGYKMLPMEGDDGGATGAVILLWSVTLIPATLAPILLLPERLGMLYAAVAILSGLVFLAAAARLAVTRTRTDARRVFLGSIMHLPLILIAMVADAALHAF